MRPESPQWTISIIRRRKLVLRAEVLMLALIIVGAVVLLAVSRRLALACIALAPALWSGYLLADCMVLRTWRRHLLRAWQAGDVNLASFAVTVASVPVIPQATLAAMLRSLPILTPVQDRDLDPGLRIALAGFSNWRWAEASAAVLLPSTLLALLSVAGASLLLGWASPDAQGAVVLLALLAGLLLVRFGIPGWHRRRLARAVAALTPEAAAALPDLVASLDWSATPIAHHRKMRRRLEQLVAR